MSQRFLAVKAGLSEVGAGSFLSILYGFLVFFFFAFFGCFATHLASLLL